MTRQTVGDESRDGDLSVAGVLSAGAGSASAPSITNTGDENTGLLFPAADTVAISTGGTERLRIDSNGLITGTGTSLGAWTAYTPTLGGTGWALGDGTVTGAYAELGKIIAFRVRIVFGSTSTFGAAAALTVTAPVTSRNAGAAYSLTCRLFDASLSESWNALASLAINSTTMTIRSWNGDNKAADTSATVPFTWASSDEVIIHGVYERS